MNKEYIDRILKALNDATEEENDALRSEVARLTDRVKYLEAAMKEARRCWWGLDWEIKNVGDVLDTALSGTWVQDQDQEAESG